MLLLFEFEGTPLFGEIFCYSIFSDTKMIVQGLFLFPSPLFTALLSALSGFRLGGVQVSPLSLFSARSAYFRGGNVEEDFPFPFPFSASYPLQTPLFVFYVFRIF